MWPYHSGLSSSLYVEIALNGYNFCTAARETLAMSVKWPTLFALVGRVAIVVKCAGHAIIVSVSVTIVALLLFHFRPEDLNNMGPPLLVVAIGALTIGELMLHPFAVAARANLHCYCMDVHRHDEALYTPHSMQRLIETHGEAQ